MDYRQTVDYLYTQLPMYSRIGAAAYKADLHNTVALCEALGNPERKFKSVHIAGTNGKGSTSHMLASVLAEAGYRTGLYTSPHLYDFRERIRIDGKMISEAFVVDFVQRIQPLVAAIQPSFFEITVAMAFAAFAEANVDIAIIETGLGGRLDSTNLVVPELSLITNIGYDHQALLGDTLAEIAAEKAGIIKPGVPVVIGEKHRNTEKVFVAKAADVGSTIHWAEERYKTLDLKPEKAGLQWVAENRETGALYAYDCDLRGFYQAKNLRSTRTALDVMIAMGWKIPESAVDRGLRNVVANTGLAGRWEVLQRSPMLVLDVAHNREGMKEIRHQLAHTPHRELHIVLGMVRDKDVLSVLRLLPTHARFYFTQAAIPRALPAIELSAQAEAAGLTGECYGDVNAATQAALEVAHPDDLILISGSFFHLAELDRKRF